MRLFELQRTIDPVGVSGTGIVAQGVEFDNGRCAVTFLNGKYKTVTPHDSLDSVLHIHCHEGTRLIWLDGSEFPILSDRPRVLAALAHAQFLLDCQKSNNFASMLFALRQVLAKAWGIRP